MEQQQENSITEQPQEITEEIRDNTEPVNENGKIEVLKKKRIPSQKQKEALKKAREQKKLKKMMEKQMETLQKKQEKQQEPKRTDTEILTTSFMKHLPMLAIGLASLGAGYYVMSLMKSKMNSYKKPVKEESIQLNQMEVMEKFMKIQETESQEKSQDIPETSMKTTKLNLHF